jgi:hypothetical protein
MNRKAARFAFPCLITLFLGGLYFRTLSPGLTWANDGADGGDLIAAIETGGVPHPSGYPTYLLIGSAFAKLPVGSAAFRLNLFSSACMVLALLAFYQLVLALTDSRYIASLSTLTFGSFPLVWSQALITEVHALQTLLTVLVLLFFLSNSSRAIRGFLGGITFGLALGNHLSGIFLIPFLFINNQSQKMALLKRAVGLCLGLGVYLVIPMRAHNQSPVNWGNAVDWHGFWWLVSGEMYQGRLSHFSAAYLAAGLQEWAHFMIGQLGIPGLAIGLLGLALLFRPSRLYLGTVWLAVSYSLFSIVYFSPDSYVYLIPALMAFAVWIGLGINFALEKFSTPQIWSSLRGGRSSRRSNLCSGEEIASHTCPGGRCQGRTLARTGSDKGLNRIRNLVKLPSNRLIFKSLLMAVPVLLIAFRAVLMIPEQDLSTDHRAEQYAQAVLTSLPDRAIVFTKGDEALFSLWYFHYGDHRRSDVAVVSEELLTQPWYRDVLEYTYSDLNVPDTAQIQAFVGLNPQRSVCILEAGLEPRFACNP